ncbi:MAG TPA: hypothetical protein VGA73_01390 [Candidatus Binatia bacterium]
MKHLGLGLAAMALLALTAPAAAAKKTGVACGTAYSVGDASLLLQHHGKFNLVDIGADAAILDGRGRPLALAEIRPGDWIEYRSEDGAVIKKISVNAEHPVDCAKPQVLGKN